MATAIFYKIAKRKNSTLIPTNGTAVEVDLKSGTDLISPSFLIQSETQPDYNLLKYEDRYYFIDKVISVRNNLWSLECTEDFGATWKTNIQNTTAYVLFHTHDNTEICDHRLSTKTTPVILSNTAAFDILGNTPIEENVVIMNVVGEDNCCTIAISQADAKDIMNNFDAWLGAFIGSPPPVVYSDDIHATTAIAKYLYLLIQNMAASGKALDCIKNAFILPLNYGSIVGTEGLLKLGKYTTAKPNKNITNRIFSDGCVIDIPWQTDDWRRNSPYTELYLYIPYIGLIQLSTSDLIGASSINISLSLDVSSGDAIFKVYNGNQILHQTGTNLASPYAIGTSNINPMQVESAILSAAGGVASVAEGNIVGGATTTINAFNNIISGQPTCIGSNSGGATLGLDSNCVLFTVLHDTVAEPSSISSTIGTPTNKVMSLSGISGYVQTNSASVSGTMLDAEREAVNNLMNGGIYIE